MTTESFVMIDKLKIICHRIISLSCVLNRFLILFFSGSSTTGTDRFATTYNKSIFYFIDRFSIFFSFRPYGKSMAGSEEVHLSTGFLNLGHRQIRFNVHNGKEREIKQITFLCRVAFFLSYRISIKDIS